MTKIDNAIRHGQVLVDLLVDTGPLTRAEVLEKLGWTSGRFDGALRAARQDICPSLDMTIPHPTPEDGWRYQVTMEWGPVEAGASHSMGTVEARLRSILRDVTIVKPALDPRSKEGRRANFLSKHLSHLLGTLSEINDG